MLNNAVGAAEARLPRFSAGWLRPDVRSAPVDGLDRFVSYHPGVVPGWKHVDIAGAKLELSSVGHPDSNPSGAFALGAQSASRDAGPREVSRLPASDRPLAGMVSVAVASP